MSTKFIDRSQQLPDLLRGKLYETLWTFFVVLVIKEVTYRETIGDGTSRTPQMDPTMKTRTP